MKADQKRLTVVLYQCDFFCLRNNKLCTISSFLFLFILVCHCVTLSLPECLIGFCKVTLTFESVDEIL